MDSSHIAGSRARAARSASAQDAGRDGRGKNLVAPPPPGSLTTLGDIPTSVGRLLFRIFGPGGWIGLTGYLGVCAYCFAMAKRDTWAEILGVPAQLLSIDVQQAVVVPTILVSALSAGALALFVVLVIVAARIRSCAATRPPRKPETHHARRLWTTIKDSEPPRAIPAPVRGLLPLLLIVGYVLVIAPLGPFLSLETGSMVANLGAAKGHQFVVLTDHKPCPPTPQTAFDPDWYCVIVVEGGGEMITRWISSDGQLGELSLTSDDPGAGYTGTVMDFPAVRSAPMRYPQ